MPVEVLERAKWELVNWHEAGMSVMEMSHRGAEFMRIAAQAEADLRKLASIPENYKVLFLQGGATMHFSAVPMNLLRGGKKADYVHTGEWAKKAIAEAKKFCEVNVVAFQRGPQLHLRTEASHVEALARCRLPARVHERDHRRSRVPVDTGHGFHAARCRRFVTHPFAAARCLEVRADLRGRAEEHRARRARRGDRSRGSSRQALPETPNVLNYKLMAEADSMLNTPPTFSVYLAGLTFKWILERGGLAAIEKANIRKAKLLYATSIRRTSIRIRLAKEDRSRMNVPFRLRDDKLDARFLEEAEALGLSQLKGHRSVGGMRASIYNAMPIEGVEALLEFLEAFRKKNG